MICNVRNRSLDEIWLGKTKPYKGKARNQSQTEFRGKCPHDGSCKRVLFLVVDLINTFSVIDMPDRRFAYLPASQDLSSLLWSRVPLRSSSMAKRSSIESVRL
jgi:hypothetical protein